MLRNLGFPPIRHLSRSYSLAVALVRERWRHTRGSTTNRFPAIFALIPSQAYRRMRLKFGVLLKSNWLKGFLLKFGCGATLLLAATGLWRLHSSTKRMVSLVGRWLLLNSSTFDVVKSSNVVLSGPIFVCVWVFGCFHSYCFSRKKHEVWFSVWRRLGKRAFRRVWVL